MMVQDELELWMIGRPLKGPEVDFDLFNFVFLGPRS